MRLFIDFEATQFSNHILSIGCVSETGDTFKSLVRPLDTRHHKLTNFITDLTGITKEDLATAPDANEAFAKFFEWWIVVSADTQEAPTFVCFGDCDKLFVETTLKNVTSTKAILGLSLIAANLKDEGPIVANYFGRKAIGLKRVYNLIKNEDENQRHDALEDAQMLKYVLEHLNEVAADSALPPAQPKPKQKKAPQIFIDWPNGKKHKFTVDTFADETDYVYKCTDTMGLYTKYFDSLRTAALWVFKYLDCGALSPKRENDIVRVEKNIERGIRKQQCPYGFRWEVKE